MGRYHWDPDAQLLSPIPGQHDGKGTTDVFLPEVRGRAGREAVAFDVRHLDALGELALVRDEGVGGDDEARDHPLNALLFLLLLDLRKRAPLRVPDFEFRSQV